jgi:hypothetical protein
MHAPNPASGLACRKFGIAGKIEVPSNNSDAVGKALPSEQH